MKDNIKIVINSKDIKPSYGHQERPHGCGPHRNKKYDKKIRREQDKKSTKD